MRLTTAIGKETTTPEQIYQNAKKIIYRILEIIKPTRAQFHKGGNKKKENTARHL